MMNQTKKMRRIQLSNLPLYLGLNEESIIKVATDYMVLNYLNDPENQNPILLCEINRKDRTCVLELSSVEEANRLSKIRDIAILGVNCKVTRLGESMYGTTVNMATILTNSHNIAKAQAAAYQAINLLSTSDGKLDLDTKDLNLETPPSRVIKIMNLVDPQQARMYTEKEYRKVLDDIVYECSKYIQLEHIFIIKNNNATIGAEPGAVFLVTGDKEKSLELMRHMVGQKYNGREYKMVCVPEETYRTHFARLGQ